MPEARPSLAVLRRSLAVVAAAAAFIGPSIASAQAVTPGSGETLKAVSFQGHTFKVPGSWEVVDLNLDPTACVRFDRHAVYLGTPGPRQNCPTRLVGRTEALVLEADPSGTAAQQAGVRELDREIVSGAKGIRVTATYGADQALVRSILTASGMPLTAPKQTTASHSPDALSAASVTGAAATAVVAGSGADLTNYTGKGFDACAAPDSATMNAWKANSPYRAVGIYIGGSNRGCSQPNLTASWVQQQAAAGWRFMPLYVGLQADEITSPAAQGKSAADDAVNRAAALGLGSGALLYYDMEAYSSTYSGKVLAFLAAWTEQLHARGYNSAVYSSATSGIADLAANVNNYTMPDVVFTARWNHAANTDDPVLPGWAWAQHQRVHQYDGEVTETWGGKTINIDRDYLDVALVGRTATVSTAGVYRPGESVFYVSDKSGGVAGYAGFGAAGDVPLTGDWNRDGKDTFGVYRPSTRTFLLTNDNSTVGMESTFGDPGDVPLVGDWDGDGVDTIGVYRPSDQSFSLTNDNLTVAYSLRMGIEGDKPMVGDWNGDGKDTIGVYRGAETTFYLSDSNTSANVDHNIKFGDPGDVPVKGDWNGDGTDKVGVYRPAQSDFYGAAKDSNQVIYNTRFGNPGDLPTIGQW